MLVDNVSGMTRSEVLGAQTQNSPKRDHKKRDGDSVDLPIQLKISMRVM